MPAKSPRRHFLHDRLTLEPAGSGASMLRDAPTFVARAVGAALRRINDDLTLDFEPLAQQVDESLAADRVLAVLSGFFGAVALLLAGLGLYGVTAYAVAWRASRIDPAELLRQS